MEKIVVGFLGCGNIGCGVYKLLETYGAQIEENEGVGFEVRKILVRSLNKSRAWAIPPTLLTDRPEDVLDNPEIDMVMEFMGGEQPAASYMVRALENGKCVITANKMALATHWTQIVRAAREHAAGLYYEASVCGAVPIIRAINGSLQANRISSVMGIINGTTNYMLDMMQSEGLDYDAALSDAQRLGYAEADPTADVSGLDALRKIMLACAVAYDMLPSDGLKNEGIESLRAADVADLKRRGLCCRLVTKGGRNADGSVYAYVQPVLLTADAPECAVKKNFNMAKYHGKNSGDIVLMGQGAGRYPTASAVLRDLECLAIGQREMLKKDCREVEANNDSCLCRYYVRCPAALADEFDCESAEREGDVVRAVVKPISVSAMHEKVRALRRGGAEIFFAELA